MSRSRALEPEIKALKAVERALQLLDGPTKLRVLEYTCARALHQPWHTLADTGKNVRLVEALRWIRREIVHPPNFSTERAEVLALIDRLMDEAQIQPAPVPANDKEG